MRALTWDHVDLDGHPGDPAATAPKPPRPPSIEVWRSVRADGDTKTEAGPRWTDHNLVFCASIGTPLDAANVRRAFKAITKAAGLDPAKFEIIYTAANAA